MLNNINLSSILIGSENGEMIVWKIDSLVRTLIPSIKMMPCLDQSIGSLNDFTILNSQ